MTDLPPPTLIGSSPAFQTALAHLRTFARVDATVLIEGETGTGKELAARTIHALGERNAAPFVLFNCAALGGHEFEHQLLERLPAGPDQGGTLLLDEVDMLCQEAQAALLRFLQEHARRAAGSADLRRANVRILAATNASLRQLVVTGKFRADLLYRLNVLVLRMPPLRERAGDALELARSFVQRYSAQYGPRAISISPAFEEWLSASDWPGNVRELENFIYQECLVCAGGELRAEGEAAAWTGTPGPGFHWARRGAAAATTT